MPEDIEDFRRYMALPETNQACFEAMLQDCMASADQAAVMKALTFVLKEKQS